MFIEIALVNASVLASLISLLGISYIENHMRVHEINTKNHTPNPRINNTPL